MKKIILISIFLFLPVLLAACKNDGINEINPNTNEIIEPTPDPIKKWEKTPGWEGDETQNRINGVWASDVLPDCVPDEIPGVNVVNTTYKETWQNNFSGFFGINGMDFADNDYEAWSLRFYCTTEQRDLFLLKIEANGFYGGLVTSADDYSQYNFAGNGYFVYLYEGKNDEEIPEGFDLLMIFNIVPSDKNERPMTFQGLELPQFGVVIRPYNEGIGYGYNENGDYIENFWNALDDQGVLPPGGWFIEYNYFGATQEQVQEYVRQMADKNWDILSESIIETEVIEGGTPSSFYSAQLINNDVYAVIEFPYNVISKMHLRFETKSGSFYD